MPVGRRRGTTSRAAAVRRAQQAKAERDAERALRERQIEIALADYFQARAAADRIRADALHRADAAVAAGEQAAGEPEAAARDAIRQLRELTGTIGETAALAGITTGAVRELLAGTRPSPDGPEVTGSGGVR